MTGITVVYDATHDYIGSLPPGASYAGYTTGTDGIPWTDADWAKYPDAIRIDQSPSASEWDSKADVDDYENGAVTIDDLAPRAKERLASFKSNARPGQRMPVVYVSQSNLTGVANALKNGGVTGVGLWVANWNLTQVNATSEVLGGSGPYPIVGIQFHDAGSYDVSVFTTAWLTNRSGGNVAPKKPAAPVKASNQKGWEWCHKCQGLFYGPNETASKCPAGGAHDGTQSGVYTLADSS